MSIFDSHTINKIKELSQSSKKEFSKNDYINDVFKLFNPVVTNYFNSEYLFHNIIFSDRENQPTIFYFDDMHGKQNKYVKKYVQNAEEIALKGIGQSIGIKVVALKIPFLVLYNSKQTLPPYVELKSKLNLNRLNTRSSYSSFIKHLEVESLVGINPILQNYALLSQYLESYFIYFIRPITNSKAYNVVLLLILTRPLLESEYLEISFILFMIFSVLAEKHIELLSKSEEWESIVNEQNHTAKHMLNALGVQVASLLDFPEVYNNTTTRSIVNKAKIYIDTINKTNDYLLSMMRVQGGSKEMYEILEIRGVHLKRTLLNMVEIIEVTLFALGLSYNESEKRENRIKEKCIPLLRKSINLLPNIGIQVGHIGFEIVLIELLKNAVFHTDNKKPKVEVFFKNEKNKRFCTLHIMNNIGVSKDQFDFINKGKNRDNISKQYKSGIRTITRILEFDGFSNSKTKWNRKISKQSLYPSGTTDIFLIIPKSDIYE